MQALNRFEPERDVRFSTYAMWWIKASIQDYILRSWSLVKIGTTAAQRKLFSSCVRPRSGLPRWKAATCIPIVAQIAKDLEVADHRVVQMNRRLVGDKSINVPLKEDGEAGEWQDRLVDGSPSPETIVAEQDEKERRLHALSTAVEVLSGRERQISRRGIWPTTPNAGGTCGEIQRLARAHGQIEVRAFEKVRKATRNFAANSPALVPAS